MGVPIVKGRNFNDGDRADGQRVMIVSARLAAVAFPGQDPIGKRISCCEAGPWRTESDRRRRRRHPFAWAGGGATARVLPADRAGARATCGTGSARCTSWCGRTGDPAALIKPLSAAVTERRSRPAALRRADDGAAAGGIAGDGAVQHAAALAARRDRPACSRRPASTASSPTSSASGRRRSACAWRSAPRPASVVRLVLGQALRPVALGAAIGVAAALARQPRAGEPAVRRQPHRPLDDRRGRRHTHRGGAGGERRTGAPRGGGRSDAGAAVGIAIVDS